MLLVSHRAISVITVAKRSGAILQSDAPLRGVQYWFEYQYDEQFRVFGIIVWIQPELSVAETG